MRSDFAVIFDMDGILFDSEQVYIEGYVKYASHYHDIRETSLSCVGANGIRTREIFLEKYGEEFPFDEYYQKVKAYVQAYPIPLKKGAVSILKFLSEKNIPVALASSTSTKSVMKMLGEAEILPYFDKIICGDMVSRSKPCPDIFLKACEELGYSPESCYVIEDSYNGIRAAKNAGAIPVMVPDILQPDEEIREKLSYLFPDLTIVQAFFDSLIQNDSRAHTMMLTPEPFEMIESGNKTIELRLYDEKRRKIAVGDPIRFICTEDENKTLDVTVKRIYVYSSFKELYSSLPLMECGYTAEEITAASAGDMDLYYSEELQKKYPAVGIEIKTTINR